MVVMPILPLQTDLAHWETPIAAVVPILEKDWRAPQGLEEGHEDACQGANLQKGHRACEERRSHHCNSHERRGLKQFEFGAGFSVALVADQNLVNDDME